MLICGLLDPPSISIAEYTSAKDLNLKILVR
jgi:hypothetical protein